MVEKWNVRREALAFLSKNELRAVNYFVSQSVPSSFHVLFGCFVQWRRSKLFYLTATWQTLKSHLIATGSFPPLLSLSRVPHNFWNPYCDSSRKTSLSFHCHLKTLVFSFNNDSSLFLEKVQCLRLPILLRKRFYDTSLDIFSF